GRMSRGKRTPRSFVTGSGPREPAGRVAGTPEFHEVRRPAASASANRRGRSRYGAAPPSLAPRRSARWLGLAPARQAALEQLTPEPVSPDSVSPGRAWPGRVPT